MNPLSTVAFFADKAIKSFYIARAIGHQKADEIVKGQYWENGKGCAVGCTIHGSNHQDYETELGLPEWLARAEDTIFEGLPAERAKLWPVEFLEAANVGADLNFIKAPFIRFILETAKKHFDHSKFPEVLASIEQVQALMLKYPEGHATSQEAQLEFTAASRAASRAASDAAYVASDAAYAAYAASDAAYAASRVAYATSDASRAASDAASDAASRAASDAAYAASDAAYAASRAASDAASEQAYATFADELLRLMKACKA